jgi:hypothetical protein
MSLLTLAVVLALIATIVTLAWGLGSMAKGGSYDEKHSEQLMFVRIGIQTFAFVMLMLAVYLTVG